MPRLAYVNAVISCPGCGFVHDHVAQFQWGYCRTSQPTIDDYEIGDTLRWRTLENGRIPDWTYFPDGEANIGDPAIINLILTDVGTWSWYACQKCPLLLGGAAVRIENGIITKAWLFAEGEFDANTDVYLIELDGTLTPKPEWFDHSMQFLNDDGTPTYPGGFTT